MDRQDWTPVVLKKNKSHPLTNTNVSKNIDNDDIPERKKQTEKKEQLSMMQSRLAHGYKSQKDLANATNGKISVARINKLESGRGDPPQGFEKTLLFKLLKIKFKS
tara:strand:+ start:647 stop:964 length:318 start_codon:yes stop_codon:yes gene_type:complete